MFGKKVISNWIMNWFSFGVATRPDAPIDVGFDDCLPLVPSWRIGRYP